MEDDVLERLESEFTLVFTGMSRRASSVLSESPEDEADRLARLRAIRSQADEAQAHLECGDLAGLGATRGRLAGQARNYCQCSNEELDALDTESSHSAPVEQNSSAPVEVASSWLMAMLDYEPNLPPN